MGHSDLDIDVSQMPPLLESHQISLLHTQSVSIISLTASELSVVCVRTINPLTLTV